MADHSKIEWTDATWNPIVGCSIATPGCTNCYAMRQAHRIEAMMYELVHQGKAGAPHYLGTTKVVNGKPVWTGRLAMADDAALLAPLKRRKPTTYFVNSMGDLFHEDVPDAWIDRVFAVMALAPQHTFQVLTKRAARMRKYFEFVNTHNVLAGAAQELPSETRWPLPNVWLGVSAEDQRRADERIPHLLVTPAAVRFISAEPLLGPINLTKVAGTACLAHDGACCGDRPWLDALRGIQGCSRAGAYGYPERGQMPRGLDWIIVGGESGPGARPMHPDWARSLRDQCSAADVPFFFKQWGAHFPIFGGDGALDSSIYDGPIIDGVGFAKVGKKVAGRLLDGVEFNGMPEVRQ